MTEWPKTFFNFGTNFAIAYLTHETVFLFLQL